MKYIPASVTQKLATVGHQLRQNAPHITFGVGAAAVVTGTVLACKATLHLESEIDRHDAAVYDAKENNIDSRVPGDIAYTYARTAGRLAKLYSPSAILLVSGLGLMTHSHVTMSRRNKALTLAYAGLYKAFEEYRDRVREQIGEEAEFDLYHNVESETAKDEEGNDISLKIVDPDTLAGTARLFDEYNHNWQKNAEYNKLFLQCQQNYLNDQLQARGHVFLNDVYDQLGMERTSQGQLLGWFIDDDPDYPGDGYIDFGIYNARNVDFVSGHEPSILLTFNVDGEIASLI